MADTVAGTASTLSWDELVADLPPLRELCVVCARQAVIRTHRGYRCQQCEPFWDDTLEGRARVGAGIVRRALAEARHARNNS